LQEATPSPAADAGRRIESMVGIVFRDQDAIGITGASGVGRNVAAPVMMRS